MSIFTVKYYVGTYEGERCVNADCSDTAISKVRSWARKEMSLPMYYESYKIVNVEEVYDE